MYIYAVVCSARILDVRTYDVELWTTFLLLFQRGLFVPTAQPQRSGPCCRPYPRTQSLRFPTTNSEQKTNACAQISIAASRREEIDREQRVAKPRPGLLAERYTYMRWYVVLGISDVQLYGVWLGGRQLKKGGGIVGVSRHRRHPESVNCIVTMHREHKQQKEERRKGGRKKRGKRASKRT